MTDHKQSKPSLGSGLTDKLYWRMASDGRWHCFKRMEGGGYISLCRRHTRERSDGQACYRPRSELRCGMCDGKEMERRGHTESLPASKDNS